MLSIIYAVRLLVTSSIGNKTCQELLICLIPLKSSFWAKNKRNYISPMTEYSTMHLLPIEESKFTYKECELSLRPTWTHWIHVEAQYAITRWPFGLQ